MERTKVGKVVDLASLFPMLDQPQATAATSNPKKKRKMTEKAKQKLENDILSMDAEDREVLLGRVHLACQNQNGTDPSLANEKHLASSELSQLRLELGCVLQKQAELKTREKKVRGLIKKLHRQESRLEMTVSTSKQAIMDTKYTEEMILKRLFGDYQQPSHVDAAHSTSSSSSSLWALARHEMLSQTESRRLQPERDCQLLEEIVGEGEKMEEEVIDLEADDNDNYSAPAAANSILSQFICLFNNNDDREDSHEETVSAGNGVELSTLVRALIDTFQSLKASESDLFVNHLEQPPDLEVSLKDALQAMVSTAVTATKRQQVRHIIAWQQSVDTIAIDLLQQENCEPSVILQFWSLSGLITKQLLSSLQQQLMRSEVQQPHNETINFHSKESENNYKQHDTYNNQDNDEKENYNSQQQQSQPPQDHQQIIETPTLLLTGQNKRKQADSYGGDGDNYCDLLSTSSASKRQKKLLLSVTRDRDPICLITPNIKETTKKTTKKVDVDLCYSDSGNDSEMGVEKVVEEEQERYVPLFERLKTISTQLERQQRQQQPPLPQEFQAPALPVIAATEAPITSSGGAAGNLHVMSIQQLQAMCTRYGLVMNDDRDRMVRLLTAILATNQSAPQPVLTQQQAGGKATSQRAPRSQTAGAGTSKSRQQKVVLPSPAQGAALTVKEQNIIDQVANFVQEDEDLYGRILSFLPLAPEEVLNKMIASGETGYGVICYQHIRTALDHMHVFVKGLPRKR